MGKKGNKNQGANFDDDFKEGDFSHKFVSHKQQVAKEAAIADKAVSKANAEMNAAADSDDGAANKKQRKKKGGQQDNDEFDQPTKSVKTKVVAAGDSDREIDLEKEIGENFEGMNKKNTRKKKNNNANIYGDADIFAGAVDEEADESEVHAKKGGKTNKGGKHQGKKDKKKLAKEDSEEEEKEAEPVAASEESEKEETEAAEFPINMVYCGQCGLPPEYCEYGQKDSTACKEWLDERYPPLFAQIYGTGAVVVKKAKTVAAPKEEEKNADPSLDMGDDDEPVVEKKVKKVKFSKELGVITIYKQKRGGKKTISQICGFEYYTKNMKDLASKFGKKFSCGCNLADDEIHGPCISVQGDVEDRLLDILEQDKELAAMNIPIEKIKFIEDGNKKGRKRAPKPSTDE